MGSLDPSTYKWLDIKPEWLPSPCHVRSDFDCVGFFTPYTIHSIQYTSIYNCRIYSNIQSTIYKIQGKYTSTVYTYTCATPRIPGILLTMTRPPRTLRIPGTASVWTDGSDNMVWSNVKDGSDKIVEHDGVHTDNGCNTSSDSWANQHIAA